MTSSEEEDEQYARDLQYALNIQAEEERNAVSHRSRRHHEEAGEYADRRSLGQPDHMLFVICELEGKAVEMLVDSGASTSVISITMVHQLGLLNHVRYDISGQASGVGSANIVGIMENLICTMGHVEFRLFFLVLDSNDPWLILGLDQMRRFKCVIDLERNAILFGGREGVEVPFLDTEMAAEAAAKKILAASSPMAPAAAPATNPPLGRVIVPPPSSTNHSSRKTGITSLFKKRSTA